MQLRNISRPKLILVRLWQWFSYSLYQFDGMDAEVCDCYDCFLRSRKYWCKLHKTQRLGFDFTEIVQMKTWLYDCNGGTVCFLLLRRGIMGKVPTDSIFLMSITSPPSFVRQASERNASIYETYRKLSQIVAI